MPHLLIRNVSVLTVPGSGDCRVDQAQDIHIHDGQITAITPTGQPPATDTHAGEQHLRARQPRADPNALGRQVDLHRPDPLVEPVVDRQILGRTPHHHHGTVRMRVDQPRHRHQPGPVNHLRPSIH